ncbi:hypothetical protein MAR_005794 [Mya arenaria]|uniref:Transposase n=1 Tax=Mya arenaria TaxID=6604 RepID=A0ABY7F2T3_MYAAR|nr:hypothetical protein MAR_005794 [Mya arenaria]
MVDETTDVSIINEMIVYIRMGLAERSSCPCCLLLTRRQIPSELPSLTSVNLLLDWMKHMKSYFHILSPFLTKIVGKFPEAKGLQPPEVPWGETTCHGENGIKSMCKLYFLSDLAEHFHLPVNKILSEWRQVRNTLRVSGFAADQAIEWVDSIFITEG